MTSPSGPPVPQPGRAFDLPAIGGGGLPFARSLAALAEALGDGAAGGTAVVQAPPGTGKTTLVPPLLANLVARPPAGAPQRPAGLLSPSRGGSPPAPQPAGLLTLTAAR